jgi:EAL domain-containing protein (putative c-di-GMP-specific phosphodiesterase class I)
VFSLRSALRTSDQLFLHYQPIKPIADLSSPPTIFEALLRAKYYDPEARGDRTLTAGQFIDQIYADSALCRAIDLWVINAVAAYARQNAYKLAVNVNDCSLHDGQFPSTVQAILGTLKGDRFLWEINERATYSGSSEQVLSLLPRFGDVWLDDFGSKKANLGTLLKYHRHLKGVKIDGAIVRCVAYCPMAESLVRSVFLICERHDFDCVAEWVESIDILDKLRSVASEYPGLKLWVQGWAIG